MKLQARYLPVLLLVLLLVGCGKPTPTPLSPAESRSLYNEAMYGNPNGPTATASTTRNVIYKLSGSLSFDVTMQTPSGTSQKSKESPGEYTFEFEPGDFVYVSAQTNTKSGVHCEITVDGSVIAENDSSGEFSIVTCDGRA